MSGLIVGIAALVGLVGALIWYLSREDRIDHVELERVRGNRYRFGLAVEANSGGYFYECPDGRYTWKRL